MTTGNSNPTPERAIYDRFRALATWLATLAFGSAVLLLLLLVGVDWRSGEIPDRVLAVLAFVELALSVVLGTVVRLRIDVARVSPGIARFIVPFEALFARAALGRVGEPRTLAKTLEFQFYTLVLGSLATLAYILFVTLEIGWLVLTVLSFTVGSAAISLGGFGLARDWLWQRVRRNAAGRQDA